MELATVKSLVKSWEKGFKAKHGRDPGKEDIKKDTGGIAEQYALYRRLAKDSSRIHSSASTSTSNSTSTNPLTTPRNHAAFPTTPTPPPRRTTQPPSIPFPAFGGPPKSLKRTASKASLPASPPRLATPKKGYNGPIHDPNPLNPFSLTPKKSVSEPIVSPFIHASSPRKLKEVLELNSLKKLRDRDRDRGRDKESEITPRTRARKRLRGEMVDDTPIKDRVGRRRGTGSRRPSEGNEETTMGKRQLIEEEEEDEDERNEEAEADDADEDEFGPSPAKPLNGRGFTSLFGELENEKPGARGNAQSREEGAAKKQDDFKGKGKQSTLLGMFARLPKAPSLPAKEQPAPTIRAPSPSPPPPSPPSPLVSQTTTKYLSISDDEAPDEWDPEGGRRSHKVAIVGTRRKPIRRDSWDDLLERAQVDEDREDEEEEEGDEGDEGDEVEAPPLFSLLSLASPIPKQKSKLNNMTVKAIFDPIEAKRLLALKRGQDIYAPGADGDEGEEEDGEEEEGEDEWESENEGWKKEVTGEEDDW
ncbi:hypothetical protein P7C73_g2492, partial [Tremellales sp. Uapishka_1]